MDSEAAIVWVVGILVLAFWGEPDLIDALIAALNAEPQP
jgi:hypothetical protein